MSGRHDKYERRAIRHLRIRKRVRGTTARPRLSVFRSARHIYAQIIDDVRGVTLAAASSRDISRIASTSSSLMSEAMGRVPGPPPGPTNIVIKSVTWR